MVSGFFSIPFQITLANPLAEFYLKAIQQKVSSSVDSLVIFNVSGSIGFRFVFSIMFTMVSPQAYELEFAFKFLY